MRCTLTLHRYAVYHVSEETDVGDCYIEWFKQMLAGVCRHDVVMNFRFQKETWNGKGRFKYDLQGGIAASKIGLPVKGEDGMMRRWEDDMM